MNSYSGVACDLSDKVMARIPFFILRVLVLPVLFLALLTTPICVALWFFFLAFLAAWTLGS